MLKTDPKKAIEDFLHFEDQDRKELSIKSANTLIEYEIVRFEMISDSLWQAELFAKSENIPDGRYGMNYVAVIEDSIRVMTSVNQIPAELLDGVELENYEVHGPGIVGEEDIIK